MYREYTHRRPSGRRRFYGRFDRRLVISVNGCFQGMAVRLIPERSADIDLVVGFRFPDSGEVFYVHVRRGVAEIAPYFSQTPQVTIPVNATVWKQIAARMRNPLVAFAYGQTHVEGSGLDLAQFERCLRDRGAQFERGGHRRLSEYSSDMSGLRAIFE
jgi:alkyl sulfatase BDS1-like metallo-beta-lactamase superfamily hydrolase